jgi:sulfur transfer protein SufE
MLTPEEELRVASIIVVAETELWELKKETVIWLAEKLKEVNEELKALIQEEVKDCNCVGISHDNSCPKWVLPF